MAGPKKKTKGQPTPGATLRGRRNKGPSQTGGSGVPDFVIRALVQHGDIDREIPQSDPIALTEAVDEGRLIIKRPHEKAMPATEEDIDIEQLRALGTPDTDPEVQRLWALRAASLARQEANRYGYDRYRDNLTNKLVVEHFRDRFASPADRGAFMVRKAYSGHPGPSPSGTIFLEAPAKKDPFGLDLFEQQLKRKGKKLATTSEDDYEGAI